MTGRSNRRRDGHAGGIVLAGLVLVLAALWHLLPWILAALVLTFACRRWQLHRRAWAWVTRRRLVRGHVVSSEPAEMTRLRAECDQLRAALRDAETARDAAWDAAASVPPRQPAEPSSDKRARLLNDPLSGARPL